ncbi:LysR family transcriptional regulator [uncultured Megamonas sp.]|uniref:LysR family transcriptional regulator n=1 Tax=uncultured Megamonas sp. TaxID=286140 RepID=UPI00259B41AA|nr:LysR family transcriptional regulator [uncultured Megamonas sp.]
MEIKQLEYFLAVCERGSINKAAECLYTSQPNVSKIINSLERELGRELFKRTHKGIEITPYGKTIYQYAEVILKHIHLMTDIALPINSNKLSIATYRSDIVSDILTVFYEKNNSEVSIEHYQGSIEEVTDYVKKGIAEIGLVYVAEKQMKVFLHVLFHKKLEFIPLGSKSICIYVGEKHPLYNTEYIELSDLKNLKFIKGIKDFFSLEHHLDKINIGFTEWENLNNSVYTNSDTTIVNLLMKTDLCRLGIYSKKKKYETFNIKAIKIKNTEGILNIGYVYVEGQKLSQHVQLFLEEFKKTI